MTTVAVYAEPSERPNSYSGYHDHAIVSFRLSDETNQAFFVSCGSGLSKDLCFDFRPVKPGEAIDTFEYIHPVVVP